MDEKNLLELEAKVRVTDATLKIILAAVRQGLKDTVAPIDEFPLRMYTSNVLKQAGIYYLHQLVALDEEGILRIPGLRKRDVQEIKDFLKERGLSS